jgi:hypothetical protein
MFCITDNKGFQITFANGWTVSVQFGRGNYCENSGAYEIKRGEPVPPSRTAEIAAWDADGNWHPFEYDTVEGHQTPAQVLEFMNLVAAK